jgi:hypothetical protein
VLFRRTSPENGSCRCLLSGTTLKASSSPLGKTKPLKQDDETLEKADFIWKKGNPALSCQGIFP